MKQSITIVALAMCLVATIFLLKRISPAAADEVTLTNRAELGDSNSAASTKPSSLRTSQQKGETSGLRSDVSVAATNLSSSKYAIAAKDLKSVTLCDSNGTVVWTTNVVDQLPDSLPIKNLHPEFDKYFEVPNLKQQRIASIQFMDKSILVRVGGAYIVLDERSGATTGCEIR